MSPCPLVPLSPCPLVPLSPCLRVSVSPCQSFPPCFLLLCPQSSVLSPAPCSCSCFLFPAVITGNKIKTVNRIRGLLDQCLHFPCIYRKILFVPVHPPRYAPLSVSICVHLRFKLITLHCSLLPASCFLPTLRPSSVLSPQSSVLHPPRFLFSLPFGKKIQAAIYCS